MVHLSLTAETHVHYNCINVLVLVKSTRIWRRSFS